MYLTFDEFRKNTPSLRGKVLVMKYQVRLFDEESQEFKTVKQSYWGACSNDTVYVHQTLDNASTGRRNQPLHFLDRYSYFTGTPSNSVSVFGQTNTTRDLRIKSSGIMNGKGGNVPVSVSGDAEYIVNLNNGTTYVLSDQLLKTILKNDPELLDVYENDKFRKDKFKEYISEYNARHKNDIKPIKR